MNIWPHVTICQIMDRVNIGFVGGCAITQHSVSRQNRFYSVFQKKVTDHKMFRPVFSFASYSHYQYLAESCIEVLSKNKLDLLIVHLRPQPFYILSKLIIKYLDETKGKSFYLNPLLFGKNIKLKPEAKLALRFDEDLHKPMFMDINILLGNIFKLNSKASARIYEEITKVHFQCQQYNVKLAVLGIPHQPYSKIGSSNSKKLNWFLKDKLQKNDIQYFDCFNEMKKPECYLKDKLHFSSKGHNVLGTVLFEGFENCYGGPINS